MSHMALEEDTENALESCLEVSIHVHVTFDLSLCIISWSTVVLHM